GMSVLSTLAVGGEPRAIAVTPDGARAFVTHYLTRGDSGTVSVVDLLTGEVEGAVPLVEDPGPDTPSSGRGFPHQVSAVASDRAGRFLWIGGLKSNTSEGLFLTGRRHAPQNFVRGFMAHVDASSSGVPLEDPTKRLDTNDADSV